MPPRSTASVSTCRRFTATFRSSPHTCSYEWVLKKKHNLCSSRTPRPTPALRAAPVYATGQGGVAPSGQGHCSFWPGRTVGSAGLRCWPARFPACQAGDHRVGSRRDDPGDRGGEEAPPAPEVRETSAIGSRTAACSLPTGPSGGTEPRALQLIGPSMRTGASTSRVCVTRETRHPVLKQIGRSAVPIGDPATGRLSLCRRRCEGRASCAACLASLRRPDRASTATRKPVLVVLARLTKWADCG